MKRNRVRTIVAVGLIGVLGLVSYLAIWLGQTPAATPLPQPNGYDDFLKAGQMLSPGPAELDKMSAEELREAVAANTEALRLARAGLQKTSRVPLESSTDYIDRHQAELGVFKRLTRSFIGEGKLAEAENRFGDAALAYLDGLRLGHECSRGGVIIDMLVGVACRSGSCKSMQGILGRLDAGQCREAIQALEEIDAKAESASEILATERSWSRRTFGWRGQLGALVMRRSLTKSQQAVLAKLHAQERVERMLLIGLAARAYELDKGQPPKLVADLAPNYLTRIPQDPLKGVSLGLP
jgi:hypothetical protein